MHNVYIDVFSYNSQPCIYIHNGRAVRQETLLTISSVKYVLSLILRVCCKSWPTTTWRPTLFPRVSFLFDDRAVIVIIEDLGESVNNLVICRWCGVRVASRLSMEAAICSHHTSYRIRNKSRTEVMCLFCRILRCLQRLGRL